MLVGDDDAIFAEDGWCDRHGQQVGLGEGEVGRQFFVGLHLEILFQPVTKYGLHLSTAEHIPGDATTVALAEGHARSYSSTMCSATILVTIEEVGDDAVGLIVFSNLGA